MDTKGTFEKKRERTNKQKKERLIEIGGVEKGQDSIWEIIY